MSLQFTNSSLADHGPFRRVIYNRHRIIEQKPEHSPTLLGNSFGFNQGVILLFICNYSTHLIINLYAVLFVIKKINSYSIYIIYVHAGVCLIDILLTNRLIKLHNQGQILCSDRGSILLSNHEQMLLISYN